MILAWYRAEATACGGRRDGGIAGPGVQALAPILSAASRRSGQVPVSGARDRPFLRGPGLHERARPLASPAVFGQGVRGSSGRTDRVSGSTGSARGYRRVFIPAARMEPDGAPARCAAPVGVRKQAKNSAASARMVPSSSPQKSDLSAVRCVVPDHHHALADGQGRIPIGSGGEMGEVEVQAGAACACRSAPRHAREQLARQEV